TSASGSPMTTGLQTFDTDLPIRAGQRVGLDNVNGNTLGSATIPGADTVFWNPPLADNSMLPGSDAPNAEDAFNADVVGHPGVTVLSPASGPATGGTTVTIAGQELSGATAVAFGPKRAASFAPASNNAILAVAPPGRVGPVDVTVTSPGGQSATTAGDRFTYTGCVVPNVRGRKLKRAKKTLGGASCTVKLKGRRSGKVRKQTPAAGTVLPVGGKVKLKLG